MFWSKKPFDGFLLEAKVGLAKQPPAVAYQLFWLNQVVKLLSFQLTLLTI